MKNLSHDELSLRLSQYLDGRLDPEAIREIEEYVAEHPEAGQELNELRRIKHLLASGRPIRPNPHFWTRIVAVLDAKAKEDENLLPFPRKYVPLVSVLGSFLIILIGVAVFVQREPLLEYFSQRSQAVQQVYESGVLKGSILPLFAGLTNDDVLQFAMFGTLPLDTKSETALRVDEGSDRGYRIEVGLTSERRPQPVTVGDLVNEVQPSRVQVEQIGSVLNEARHKIEKAAFYAENNALAIDPELAQLNRAVLSNIVAVLDPAQRRRLDVFLSKRNAPFALASEEMGSSSPRLAPPAPERRIPDRKDFLVITADSVMVTNLNVDLDSLMNPDLLQMRPSGHPADLHRKLARLVQSGVERTVVFRTSVSGARAPVRVTSEEDFFKIEMEHSFVGADKGAAPKAWVTARDRREKVFRFEFRSRDGKTQLLGVPGPEGRIDFEVSVDDVDSMVRKFREEQMRHMEEFRMMDSLFQEQMERSKNIRQPRRVVPDSRRSRERPRE